MIKHQIEVTNQDRTKLKVLNPLNLVDFNENKPF